MISRVKDELPSSLQGPHPAFGHLLPTGEGQHNLTREIITAARTWLGTPYLHQASLKHVGCDCLGLVRGVWRDVYGAEPELPPAYSSDWAEASSVEAMADAARRHCAEIPYTEYLAGDLLLFRWRDHLPAKHAGIATSSNRMIHAQDGVAVTEIDLSPWWKKRMAYAFRFPTIESFSLPLVGRAGVGVAASSEGSDNQRPESVATPTLNPSPQGGGRKNSNALRSQQVI